MRSASAVDLLSSSLILRLDDLDDANALLAAKEVIPGLVSVYGRILDLPLRPPVRDVAVAFALSRSWDFARDLDRAIDLARARDLTRDHALTLAYTRAYTHARAFARTLDRTLDFARARDPNPGLDLDLDLALDRALQRALDQALEPNRAREIREIALYLDRELERERDLDLALDRDLERAHASTRDQTLDRSHALALDRSVAYVLDLNVARTLERVRDRDPAHVRAREFDLDLETHCSQFMGSALSRAVTEVLRRQVPVDTLLAEFSEAFTRATGIAEIRYLASPDTLTQRLTDAVQALQATQKPYSRTGEPSWAATVAHRLQEIAGPVFNRQKKLTRDATTSIRLAALCLAAEADGLDQRELGKGFREIAAVVTLLERRAYGDDPAAETIILASE